MVIFGIFKDKIREDSFVSVAIIDSLIYNKVVVEKQINERYKIHM